MSHIITNSISNPIQLLVDNQVNLEELLFLGLVSIEQVESLREEFFIDLKKPVTMEILVSTNGICMNVIEMVNEVVVIWAPGQWGYSGKAKKVYNYLIGALSYVRQLKQERVDLFPPLFNAGCGMGLTIGSGCPAFMKRLAYIYAGVCDVASKKEQLQAKFLLGNKAPEGFKGELITEADFLSWWWLPNERVWDIVNSVSSPVDEEWSMLNGHLIYKRAEDGGVVLQKRARLSRDFYYVLYGTQEIGSLFAERQAGEVWGNILLQWFLNRTPEEGVSLRINKRATQMVASSRQYADPSPLNNCVDKGTVGRLRARLVGSGSKVKAGMTRMSYTFVNDEGPMSAANAVCAILEKDEMYAMSIQHQIKDVRCGDAGSSLGKSTIKAKVVFKDGLVFFRKDKNGKVVKKQIPAGHVDYIKLLVEQYNVDKSSKLFNRAALEMRVPPLVTVHRNEGFLSSQEEAQGDALLADLMSDLI